MQKKKYFKSAGGKRKSRNADNKGATAINKPTDIDNLTNINNRRANNDKSNARHSILIILLLMIISIPVLYFLGPAITSFVVREQTYSKEVNLLATTSGNYTLNIEKGAIKSLKMDGSSTEYGKVKVYLENGDSRYLIFSNEMIKQDEKNETTGSASSITAFASKENLDENEESKDEEKKNDSDKNNTEKNEEENKKDNIKDSINLVLEYKSGTLHDEDNDGIESIYKAVDLAVEKTNFSWDADESKLCTRWEVYDENEEKATTVCYGSGNCCSYLGLIPKRENWNDVYYASYGNDGTGSRNIISAQVIYASLSSLIMEGEGNTTGEDKAGGEAPNKEEKEKTESKIETSSWANLSVEFREEYIDFEGMCNETCVIEGLNKSSYNIVFEVENATLKIKSLRYTTAYDEENSAPELAKNISNITIIGYEKEILNMSGYFTDADNDRLSYYSSENNGADDGIIISFDGEIAEIKAGENFNGTRIFYIVANDTDKYAVSNIFSVTALKNNVSGNAPDLYKKFLIKINETNAASIEEDGNMFIKGSLHYNESTVMPEQGSFVIQNSSGAPVAYISVSGDLHLKGKLRQFDSLEYNGYKLKILNQKNESIAMFDDDGNLRLKGFLSANHTGIE